MPQEPERLPNGNLRVPFAGSTEDGTFFDGFTEIGPEHPTTRNTSPTLSARREGNGESKRRAEPTQGAG